MQFFYTLDLPRLGEYFDLDLDFERELELRELDEDECLWSLFFLLP